MECQCTTYRRLLPSLNLELRLWLLVGRVLCVGFPDGPKKRLNFPAIFWRSFSDRREALVVCLGLHYVSIRRVKYRYLSRIYWEFSLLLSTKCSSGILQSDILFHWPKAYLFFLNVFYFYSPWNDGVRCCRSDLLGFCLVCYFLLWLLVRRGRGCFPLKKTVTLFLNKRNSLH